MIFFSLLVDEKKSFFGHRKSVSPPSICRLGDQILIILGSPKILGIPQKSQIQKVRQVRFLGSAEIFQNPRF